MTNINKILGSILLVIGTSIGGAMLALPTVVAGAGFMNSIIWFIVCWSAMTIGAFCILEVSLSFPEDSNLISMAKGTLGNAFGYLTWVTYLLLLYTLLSSYMSATGDIFFNISNQVFSHSIFIDILLVSLIFGVLIYKGIKIMDNVNKGLMLIKVVLFISLVLCFIGLIDFDLLFVGNISYLPATTMVIITSFGYAIIVPSIRKYLNSDVILLRKSLLIGSLIPLVSYLVWCFVILGVIPAEGENGLNAVAKADHAVLALVNTFSSIAGSEIIKFTAVGFYSLCVLTSFLGISLCLSDFLVDGIRSMKVKQISRFNIAWMSLGPPMLVALFYPKAFLMGFRYAGYWCIYILIVLPILMVWSNRYYQKEKRDYQLWGGKPLLILGLFLAIAFLVIEIIY